MPIALGPYLSLLEPTPIILGALEPTYRSWSLAIALGPYLSLLAPTYRLCAMDFFTESIS